MRKEADEQDSTNHDKLEDYECSSTPMEPRTPKKKGKGMIHNLTCVCVTHSCYVVEQIAVGNSFLKHDDVGTSSASINEHGALLMLIILFIYTLRGRLSGCRIQTERLAHQ